MNEEERDYWSDLRAVRGCATSPEIKHLLLVLVTYCRQDSCYPSLATLARDLGISDRGVQYRLREAKEQGWISVHSRSDGDRQTSNRYIMNFEKCYTKPVSPNAREGEAGFVGGGEAHFTPGGEAGCTLMTSSNDKKELPTTPPKSAAVVGVAHRLKLADAMRIDTPKAWPPHMTVLWGDWLAVRCAEKRKAPTRRALELAIEDLERWRNENESKAVEALRNAVAGCWQGLHEPRGKSTRRDDDLGPEDEGEPLSPFAARLSPEEIKRLFDESERMIAMKEGRK